MHCLRNSLLWSSYATAHFCCCSFNPVAHTSLVKTLQRIASTECQNKSSGGVKRGRTTNGTQEVKFHMPPKDVIECLAASSAGDIRSAVNALQFACLKGTAIHTLLAVYYSGEKLWPRFWLVTWKSFSKAFTSPSLNCLPTACLSFLLCNKF